MNDKNLIKKRFQKSINSYSNNALIQKKMAQKLLSLINKNNFKDIFEIGSYSGVLTKNAIEKFDFESYLALDIINSFDYIKNLSPKISFIQADIENFTTNQKFDLILSNASLQWCNDFSSVIKKIKSFLNENGILLISIFQEDNFFEIKKSFNMGLKYPKEDEILNLFSKNVKFFKEEYSIQFENSFELIRHLKNTGVNALNKSQISISEFKKGLKILNDVYQNKITYKPLYILDFK